MGSINPLLIFCFFTLLTINPKKMSRSRNFCFTINNYTEDVYLAVCAWDCKYLVVGKEVGESGTPHLQGFVAWDFTKTLSACKKIFATAHWEISKGTPGQAAEYCKKEDKAAFEKGVLPMSQKEKGDSNVVRCADALRAVAEGRLEDVPADLLVKHLKQMEYAVLRVKASKRKLETIEGDMEHEWIWGPTGTGKSYRARSENPGCYVKLSAAKWWDDYDFEEVVLIEEVGLKALDHSEEFKVMLDRYKFRCEVKGGSLLIRPRKLVITSNYHPNDIWGGNTEAYAPIMRRLKVIHMEEPWAPSSLTLSLAASDPITLSLAASDPPQF